MAAKPTTVKAYIDALPEDRRKAIRKVRALVNKHLPKGYEEGIQYGIIGWYVPHRIYPDGYHCDPSQPLPYIGLASQKNYISLYLMCIYGDEKLRKQFEKDWAASGRKLNMGKSCVRFKDVDDVPFDVIGRAVAAVPVKDFIAFYEANVPASRRKKKKASKKKAAKKASAKKKTKKKARKKAAKRKARR